MRWYLRQVPLICDSRHARPPRPFSTTNSVFGSATEGRQLKEEEVTNGCRHATCHRRKEKEFIRKWGKEKMRVSEADGNELTGGYRSCTWVRRTAATAQRMSAIHWSHSSAEVTRAKCERCRSRRQWAARARRNATTDDFLTARDRLVDASLA